MAEYKPQTESKHPEEWERDLNPDRLQGQNIGAESPDSRADFPTAADVKEITALLQGFTMDELREIPVVPEGERLEQGKTYVDLRDPNREPFRASGEMEVSAYHWFVPKQFTPYPYWNRLVGRDSPERAT